MKKVYSVPQLNVYGNVEDMTHSAPTLNTIDVPFGSAPIGPSIDDVTS